MSNIDFQNGLIMGMLIAGKRHSSFGQNPKHLIERTAVDWIGYNLSLPSINDSIEELYFYDYPPPYEPLPEPDAWDFIELSSTINISDSVTVSI